MHHIEVPIPYSNFMNLYQKVTDRYVVLIQTLSACLCYCEMKILRTKQKRLGFFSHFNEIFSAHANSMKKTQILNRYVRLISTNQMKVEDVNKKRKNIKNPIEGKKIESRAH